MMIRAYDQAYLSRVSRAVGTMMHGAVIDRGMDGDGFLQRFIQSGIARMIEEGNPRFLAGMSGGELLAEVLERTSDSPVERHSIEQFERSDVYWTGWSLTQYQWHSSLEFRDILEMIPYNTWLMQYHPLHEADITKLFDVMDEVCLARESMGKSCAKTTEHDADGTCKARRDVSEYVARI